MVGLSLGRTNLWLLFATERSITYTDMKIIPSRQILGVMYIPSGAIWQLSPNCWDMKNKYG